MCAIKTNGVLSSGTTGANRGVKLVHYGGRGGSTMCFIMASPCQVGSEVPVLLNLDINAIANLIDVEKTTHFMILALRCLSHRK